MKDANMELLIVAGAYALFYEDKYKECNMDNYGEMTNISTPLSSFYRSYHNQCCFCLIDRGIICQGKPSCVPLKLKEEKT